MTPERKIWLKNPDGKAAASQNALKHGGYSAAEKRERRQILAFLRYNKRRVEVRNFFLKQGVNPQKQEELDNFFRTNELRDPRRKSKNPSSFIPRQNMR